MRQNMVSFLLVAVMSVKLVTADPIFSINQVVKSGKGGGARDEDAKAQKWAAHQKKHGVTCLDADDCAAKRGNFEKMDALINQHNQEAKQGKHGYTIEHNEFSHMNDKEKAARKGLMIPGGIPTDDEVGDGDITPRAALPQSVDWRNMNGVNYVTPPENQGQCGSCWTFAATAALESHWAIVKGPEYLVKLSEQNLVDCVQPANPPNGGCNGGWYGYAWDYAASNSANVLGGQLHVGNKTNVGQNLLSAYPYTGQNGNCSFKDQPMNIGANPVQAANGRGPTMYVGRYSTQALMTALQTGPVAVSIDIADATGNGNKFFHYASGIFNASHCATNIDHAVTAIGYGQETTITGQNATYWLIKNSWSQRWGEGGYMKLERATGNARSKGACGLLQYPAYPLVQ